MAIEGRNGGAAGERGPRPYARIAWPRAAVQTAGDGPAECRSQAQEICPDFAKLLAASAPRRPRRPPGCCVIDVANAYKATACSASAGS
jgi:hypothetical protein